MTSLNLSQNVSGIAGRVTTDSEQPRDGSSGSSGSSICSILGPSGAGKTTLIDILAGRKSGAGATLLRAELLQVAEVKGLYHSVRSWF